MFNDRKRFQVLESGEIYAFMLISALVPNENDVHAMNYKIAGAIAMLGWIQAHGFEEPFDEEAFKARTQE